MVALPLRGVPRVKLLCALVASCFAADGLANPTGPSVVSGTAAFNSVGKALTVTNSPNAIINWQGFSIGAGELTRFQQQSASSAVLNRVVGQDPSAILGALSSNGKVFLINPNGILFGLGSRVDVGGLVASTLNITNQDFLAGKLNFQAGAIANPVVNRGEIVTSSGGRVLLLAPDVQNHGLISSPSGEVLLAAGKSVQLVDPDVPQLKVEVQAGGEVLNVGQIFADSGKIGVYAGLIRHSGVARADSVAVGPGGVIQFRASGNVTLDVGSELSARGAQRGGTIAVSGDVVLNSGRISADGASGGTIGISGRNYLGAGSASADGGSANGGSVSVSVTGGVIATVAERLSARGAQEGGSVSVSAGQELFSSGTLEASGGRGGTITMLAPQVRLYGATLDASGDTGGGTILVGGDYKGGNPAVPNATSTWVNYSTKIRADAGQSGNGGKVIVWADNDTRYGGDISVRGGAVSGDGGFVEVSGKNDLVFVGTVNAGAPNGTAGSVLLDPKNIIIDAAASGAVSSFQLVDPNQGTSQQFPGGLGAATDAVAVLANGNVAATDPNDSFAGSAAGAVYLFNGATGALISTLTGNNSNDQVGSGGVIKLIGNNNFVVRSPSWGADSLGAKGAVTWMSGTSPFSAPVSTANSFVGSVLGDQVGSGGITALSNGNYVVASPNWTNGIVSLAGAVTWGSGTGGTVGAVSTANSLVGSTLSDSVGGGPGGGVTALTNGNYVVHSPSWTNGIVSAAGAATWGSGTGGTSGAVTTANSLVGSMVNDNVGGGSGGGVTALTNGNYVVRSPEWTNGLAGGAGAATWGSGTGGTSGAVTTANSLVGSTLNDNVSGGTNGGVTALTNGNYVVRSPSWNNGISAGDAGAVTWGNGASGVTGTLSAGNSLVGSAFNDHVGGGSNGSVTALTNGNYVVATPDWNTNKGAVTWGSGTTGVSGAVGTANSLIGSTPGDRVGSSITPLTNANYVVESSNWSNGGTSGVGAVTWGSGTGGGVGTVSTGNSTVGSQAGDFVGDGGVTALTNGNYVIASPEWHNTSLPQAGAVTWRSGTVASSGVVSTANSLFGSTSSDRVGSGGVTALTNGNYVVASPNWVNGSLTAVGAVTWASGTAATSGAVAPGNSLIGSANIDQVGDEGVVALANGNYVVKSGKWNGSVGAATFGNGATGTTGTVSSANSLVGSSFDDLKVCPDNCNVDVIALPGGDYVVRSPNWSNGSVSQVGAVTWGSGTTGVTGTPNGTNSLIGPTAFDRVGEWDDGSIIPFGAGQFLVVSRSFTQGAFSAAGAIHVVAPPGSLTNPALFADNAGGLSTISPASIVALTNVGTAVTLQANNDITLNTSSPITTSAGGAGGSITMQAGRSVLLNSNITTDNGHLSITANDPLALAGNRDPGPGGIAMAAGTTLNAGTGTVALTVGAGVGGATSGNLVVENIIATNVNLQQLGGTSGGSILPSTASSLITATNLLMESDLAGAASSSSIGSAGSPMRVQVSNLEAHTHEASPGIFISSPNQGLTIGGVPFTGSIKGVQTLAGGDISIAANGPLTVLAASPVWSTNGNVTLTSNGNMTLAGPVTAAGNMLIDAQGASSNVNVTADITSNGGAPSTVQIKSANSIDFSNGADIFSGLNPVSIILNSDSDTSGAGRISLGNGTVLNSGGGNVTLGGGADPTTGFAVGDGTSPRGVYLSGASINAFQGNISIRGKGAAGTTNATGVQLDTSSVLQTGTGSITIDGVGGNGTLGGRNRGIFLVDVGTQVISGDGTITLTGQGGNSTGFAAGPIDGRNRGIDILDGPVISTTGTGNIFLTGAGGNSVDQGSNSGVLLSQSSAIGTRITTVNGNITISGSGGTTTGASAVATANRGVSIGAAEVRATGAGSISITGTGGTTNNNAAGSSNSGILVQGDDVVGIEAFVTTAGGNLSITGTAGSSTAAASHEGIIISNRSAVQSGGTGTLTLVGTSAAGSPAILMSGGGGVVAPMTVHVEGGGALNVTANGGFLKLDTIGGTFSNEFVELVSNGNQTINAGGIVLSAGASGSNNYAEISTGASQNITITGGGNVTLSGGSGSGNGNIAIIGSNGTAQTLTFASGGNLALTGGTVGTQNFADVRASNSTVGAQTQTISGATGITLTGGTSGGGVDGSNNSLGNFARITNTNGSQAISAGAGGVTLNGGAGSLTNNFALIIQGSPTAGSPGTSQSLTINNGGVLTLQGGSSAQTNVINNATNGFRGSYAMIQSNGDSQQINFTSGGAINLTGGTIGSNNPAQIFSRFGLQTITGAPAITLTGGASGGYVDVALNKNEGNYARINGNVGQSITASSITLTGGGAGVGNHAQIFDAGTTATQSITATGISLTGGAGGGTDSGSTANAMGNFALIQGSGTQTITATGMSLHGGAGGTENFAAVTSPTQTITVHGNLSLAGGGSATGTVRGGGARIGGPGGNAPGPTDLLLIVDGNLSMAGGSAANGGAAIGNGLVGGQTTAMEIDVGGNVTLNPGTVANAESRIGSPATGIAGGDIAITAGGTLALNSTGPGLGTAIRTLGNLTLDAASITQGADSVIIAGGTTTIGGGTVSLPSTLNQFGTVLLNTTGNVTITDADAINFGASTTGSGSLTVTAPGGITQSGPITTGAATFDAGSSPITLTNGGNDFTGPVDLDTTSTIVITDANSFIIQGGGGGGSSPASLTINANGTVSQSAAFTGSGAPQAITINAGSGPITLNNASNNFSGNTTVAANTTGAVSLTNGNAGGINLGASTVGGAMSLTSGGPVTQSGPITVAGASTINAGSNAITLTNGSNDFVGVVNFTGSNVSITDVNAIAIGNSNASGALNIVATSTSFLNGFSANNYSFSGGTYALAAGTYNLGGTTSVAQNPVTGTLTVVDVQTGATINTLGGTVNVGAGGTLKGTGTIAGNVNNLAGTVSPGASPGILTITGNYTQGASGVLDMQIGGLVAGTDYDQLRVGGTTSLAGTLNTALINGFVPVSGTTFTLIQSTGAISGTFTTTNQPVGTLFNSFYGPTTVDFIAASTAAVPPQLVPVVQNTIVSVEQVLVSLAPTTTTTNSETGLLLVTGIDVSPATESRDETKAAAGSDKKEEKSVAKKTFCN